MHIFLVGFVISFSILLILLIFLRLTIPYISKLFGKRSIPYQIYEESTDWFNFVVYRIMSHFGTEESINLINEIVNSKIYPHQFRLLSLGKPPIIQSVLTLEKKKTEDIKIIIPLEWINGPSFDFILKKKILRIEFTFTQFRGKVFVSWPENSPQNLKFRFIDDMNLDYNLSIQFKNIIRFSLLQIPLLGPIIKGLLEVIITRQVFEIEFPNPTAEYSQT